VTLLPCAGGFNPGPQNLFIPNPLGHINRVLFVDSDTFYDFDGGVPGPPATPPGRIPTPGQAGMAQGMEHVNGLLFGPGPQGIVLTTLPNPVPFPGVAALGTPFFVSGINPTGVSATINITAPVGAVSVPHHPRFPFITDPLFDRVLSQGQMVCQASIQGVDPLFGQLPGTPGSGMPSMSWNVTVPPPATGGSPGVLTINMGMMDQQDVRFAISGPTALNTSGRPRIERIFSDLLTDSGATLSGNGSGVQIDMIPGSTGGGDIWCDVIIYDENGFSYRAKVRNWPNQPTNCSGDPANQRVGLGSNAPNNIDIIALCFTKAPTARTLYILPTQTIANPTGSGNFMGIIPDGTTFAALLMPTGSHPFHVQTTVDGLYFYSLTVPGLSGLMFDVVAAEYDPASGFVGTFPTATITIM
jgi:hypothetical protein